MLAREAEERQDAAAGATMFSSAANAAPTLDSGQAAMVDCAGCAIIDCLQRVGSASPREIQDAIGVSKPTAFRRLSQMVQTGSVIRAGKTTAIPYRLLKPKIESSAIGLKPRGFLHRPLADPATLESTKHKEETKT